MGFSIFLIPLLLVTVASISVDKSSMVTKIFADPEAFVATFHNADPEQIQAVIDMIDGLIATGNSEKNDAISAFENAEALSTAADEAEEAALKAEWGAVGHWNTSKEAVNEQVLIVASKKANEEELQGTKSAAEAVQTDAQRDFDQEIAVLNLEKDKLNEMRALLAEMATKADIQTRRRLLALVKIDPDKLDEVDAIIEGMIEAGETERELVTATLKTANEEVATQTDLFNAAVQAHVDSKVTLQGLEADKDAAHAVADEKVKEYEAAEADKKEKNADLEVKRTAKDEITLRVDGENSTLGDVRTLLEKLL